MQGRHRYGADAIGYFIISGASGADDMLAALLLARWAGIYDKHTGEVALDIAPQFETEEALLACGATMREAARRPALSPPPRGARPPPVRRCSAIPTATRRPAPVPRASSSTRRSTSSRTVLAAAGEQQRALSRARRQHRARRWPHRGHRARRAGRGRERRAAHPRAGRDRQAGLRAAPDRHAHARARLQRAEPGDGGDRARRRQPPDSAAQLEIAGLLARESRAAYRAPGVRDAAVLRRSSRR